VSTQTWTPEEDAAFRARADGGARTPPEWLTGRPMDPAAVSADPLPLLAGVPFLHAGKGAVISGPTGRGRSSLVQACLYDAAMLGVRCAYLGAEVTPDEFDARAAHLADVRGDEVGDELRRELARVRYLNLASVVTQAWNDPDAWLAGVQAYELVAIDPLSSVASALDLDFDKSNAQFVAFYDRIVQPIAAAGVAVVMVDNVGHAEEARSRAKGVSAKSDRADLTFSCKAIADPPALVVRCQKVRSVRAAFRVGDEWKFDRDTQQIERGNASPTDAFRPTGLMERVSMLLETDPGLSKRSIRSAVQGKAVFVDLALDLLVSEKYVERRKDGQADRHHSQRPFREAEDE
jgi:hypothetical protein